METLSFLDLPVEIHSQIFQHCLLSGAITIASRPIRGNENDNEVEGPSLSYIPGLTPGFVPAVAMGFDQTLLESAAAQSFARSQARKQPDEVECISTEQPQPNELSYFSKRDVNGNGKFSVRVPEAHLDPTLPSLHLTCQQIHDQLLADPTFNNIQASPPRNVDLYLSYPDGVCIAVHRYPHLLRVARSINVAGLWDLTGIEDPRMVKLCDRRELEEHVPYLSMKSPISPVTRLGSDIVSLETAQVSALELLVDGALGKQAMLAAEKALDEASVPDWSTDQTIPTTPSPTDEANRPPPPATHEASPEHIEAFIASHSKPPLLPTLTLRIFHPNPSERPAPQMPVRNAKGAIAPSVEQNGSASSPTRFYPARSPSDSTTFAFRAPTPPTSTSQTLSATSATPSALAMSRDPYSLLWSHSLSPATAALSCIHGGEIKMSISRGRKGNGIEVSATGNPGQGRNMTCHWPRLNLKESDHSGLGWLIPDSWGLDPEVETRKALLAWWEELKNMGMF